MRYDLIFKNGTLVTGSDTINTDIGVKDGKTVSIDVRESDTANEVYDASGLHILPGIIDAHVHFRDPGLTEKEDFETGSIAAAMGGITLVADMPNVIPVTSAVERFNEKVKIAGEKSYVDFALFALLNNENLCEMDGLKNAGALGFKIFLGTSTGDIASPSLSVMANQFRESAILNMRICLHCETSDLNRYFTELWQERNKKLTGIALSQSRPIFSEALAIQTAICYARYTNAKIHILHVTSKDGAALVAQAKQDGIDITSETCPHYLLFNAKNDLHKVFPPIRGEEQCKGLWEALKNGTIDMIASDHAPHTVAEKSLPIWEAPGGLTGVETSVPLMLNEVNKGSFTINDYVRLASEKPAKIWGIYPRKGSVQPGTDADFTIVDMNAKKTIRANDLHYKNKISPYDGFNVQGLPVATIVRGRYVMKDSKLVGEKGYGSLVRTD